MKINNIFIMSAALILFIGIGYSVNWIECSETGCSFIKKCSSITVPGLGSTASCGSATCSDTNFCCISGILGSGSCNSIKDARSIFCVVGASTECDIQNDCNTPGYGMCKGITLGGCTKMCSCSSPTKPQYCCLKDTYGNEYEVTPDEAYGPGYSCSYPGQTYDTRCTGTARLCTGGYGCDPSLGRCRSAPQSETTTTLLTCSQFCSGYGFLGCSPSSTICNSYSGSCLGTNCLYGCIRSTSIGMSGCASGEYCYCYNLQYCQNCIAGTSCTNSGPNSQCLPTCQNYCNSIGGVTNSYSCSTQTDACYDANTLSDWRPYSGVTQCSTCWCLFRSTCPSGCSGGVCTGATTTITTTTMGSTTSTSITTTTSGTSTTRTSTTYTPTTTMIPNCMAYGACDKPGDICCTGGKLYRCDRIN